MFGLLGCMLALLVFKFFMIGLDFIKQVIDKTLK